MTTSTQEAPEGERLARLEATVEALVREISDMKADIRDIRTMMNRNLLIMVALWISTIVTIFFRG